MATRAKTLLQIFGKETHESNQLVVGVNRILALSFFDTHTPLLFAVSTPSFALKILPKAYSKLALKIFAKAYNKLIITYCLWKLNESDATLRFFTWRLPIVEDDLLQTRKRLEEKANATKVEADKLESDLRGEITTLEEESHLRVNTLEEEVKSKEAAETLVETLRGEITTLEEESRALVNTHEEEVKFKHKQAENVKNTLTDDLTLTTGAVMKANTNLNELKGANDTLTKELQDKTNALSVAKVGTALEYAIKIENNNNYDASKLEDLTGLANLVFKRHLDKDPAGNSNKEKHFPFPLKKVDEHDVVSQLTNEYKILVEIKSDPILFRSFSDLLWKIFFKKNETYDNFLSFNGWIGEKVFRTTNLLACKVDAINDENDKKRKRKDVDHDNGKDKDLTSKRSSKKKIATSTTAATASDTTANTTPTKTIAPTIDYNDKDLVWTQLSPAAKIHAAELGYSQVSWDSIESLSSFSTKLKDLSSSQNLAVRFLFEGVWPPSYTETIQQHKHGEGFESKFKCSKQDAKAGEFVSIGPSSASGRQKRIRYFLIEPNGDGTWQAYRINEKYADGKTLCECPFCRALFNPQGLNMHMRCCPKNDTPTQSKKKTNKK